MTEAQEQHARALDRASRDLGDIHSLKNHESFVRYYVPRLKKKQAVWMTAFRDDPADKCPPEEREIRRRLVIEYDAILRMMDEDVASCNAQLAAKGPNP